MAPGELDALLTVARKHGVMALEVGSLRVTFSPVVAMQEPLAPSAQRDAALKLEEQQQEEDIAFYSAGG
jgi:hypothetical protein